jgi:hypothetical protein
MILLFILLTCIVQGLFYFLIRKIKYEIISYLILFAFILGNIFLFPTLFIPPEKPHEPECGNPTIGIYLSFLIFGPILSLATHFIYPIIFRKK